MLTSMLLFVAMSSLDADASEGWEVIKVADQVEVSRLHRPDSSLYEFRGIASVDLPIGVLVSLLLDHDRALEWVDLLQSHELVQSYGGEDGLIYESYDMPWPVQDRDLVMRQQVVTDAQHQTFTLTFSSVEDASLPVRECCVRALAERTVWRLQRIDADTTRVEVEVAGDPRGSLPAWLVNLIQQDWPHTTITNLVSRARQGDIPEHPLVQGWP